MKIITCLVSIAVVQIAAAASTPEPITYIEVPSGLSQSLVLDSDGSFTSRIPIRVVPSSPRLAELTSKIFDVQYRDGRSSAIAADFQADLRPADARHGDALVIQTTANSKNLRPGAYTTTVHIAPKSSPEKIQVIVLVLQKPAPTLGLGPTVVVRQRREFLGVGGGKTDAGELRLYEDSRNADLTGIELRIVPEQSQESHEVGTLQLPAQPMSIQAAGTLEASIAPRNPFPLGTSRGKIELRTPDLTNVSSVGYEVRTREHPALILLIVAIGALMGWGVRVGLQRRQELGSASILASTALEAVEDAHRRIQDPIYRVRLNEIRKTVQSASTGGGPADIVQSAKDATEKLKSLQTEFETERITELTAIGAVNDVLLKRWVLPVPIQTTLETARAKLDHISALLSDNNLTAAKSLRETLTKVELVDLMNNTLHWRLYLSRYFEALTATPPPIADPERENLRKTAEKLAENLPSAPTVSSTTAQVLDAELDIVHKLSFAATDAVDHLRTTSKDFLAWAMKALPPIQAPVQADQQRIAQLTTSMGDAITGDLLTPSLRIEEPRNRSRLLGEAWMGLLRKVTPAADLKKIEELMANGQWTEAIMTATKPSTAGGTALDATGKPAQPAREISGPPGEERSIHEGTLPQRAPALRAPLDGTLQERQRLQGEIARASFWQSVLVAILFLGGVYFLHVDSWVGTPKEMLSLLLLAFITDLTADSVVKALKLG